MRSRQLPPWLLVSAVWCGPALLSVLNAYAQARIRGGAPVSLSQLVWQGGDWLLYAVFTPVIFILSRRLPLRRGQFARNVTLHFLAALALGAAWSGAGSLFRWAVLGQAPTRSFLISWFLVTPPFAVAAYFGVVGVEHALRYLAEAREREVQAARLAQQLADARLGALQMQLHPHFLFNSLNAIAVSVRDEDTRTASRMLELLSDLLRQVLQSGAGHEVPVGEEIVFVEQYLAIEQVRFSDRLRAVVDVAGEVERAIVPRFVLQPIVENAVRHGIARRTEGGNIRVTARREDGDLVLEVIDDGPGPNPTSQPGIGIANTRERLTTLYGARGQLTMSGDSTGTRVTIRIPYHEAPIDSGALPSA